MPALLALALAASPVRLVQVVQGVPVGVLEVSVRRGQLHYQAHHVFREASRRFEVSWPVDGNGRDADGLESELLALATFQGPGCRDVREERTGKRERLCLSADGSGQLDGVSLRVLRGPGGALEAVELVDAQGAVLTRFERSASQAPAFGDPFGDGFPVRGEGAVVTLRPLAAARQVEVDGVAPGERSSASCLTAARSAVQASGGTVAVGVVVEAGRAWPHAWVERDGRSLDPTLVHDDPALAQRLYLRFPDADAGRLYLELAAGGRQVVRTGVAPQTGRAPPRVAPGRNVDAP